jgi:hypothetical protein
VSDLTTAEVRANLGLLIYELVRALSGPARRDTDLRQDPRPRRARPRSLELLEGDVPTHYESPPITKPHAHQEPASRP